MKSYICHKRVKAAKITDVSEGTVLVKVTCDDGTRITLAKNTGMLARYTPVVGDYLVEYDDGYQSFSPAKAFENGYHEIAQENSP